MKKRKVHLFVIFFFGLQLAFAPFLFAHPCPASFPSINTTDYLSPHLKKPAKNIILLIGDGFGPLHLKAMLREKKKKDTVFSSFPYRGKMTHCSLSGVTDSAASATAMATGFKTLNGVISFSSNQKPLKTILEMAQDFGKKTGLVTNTEITHATPACFAAHQPKRSMARAIATNYLRDTKPDLLVGGGRKYFRALGLTENGQKNPVFWRGYQVIGSLRSFQKAIDRPRKKPKILALFAESHMAYEWDRKQIAKKERQPALHEISEKSLEFLSQGKNGFFLMVEGGRIDHASHANDIKRMVQEVDEFSRTVSLILNWAKKKPGTLVLVTADHETGGLVFRNNAFQFSTHHHSATPVFLWGFGPNSDVIKKIQDNRAVFHILAHALWGPQKRSSPWITHDRS